MKDFLTPSLIWDLALAALILYVMIRSIGRGFVSSFIHLLGLAAACIVAALLSGKAAAWLYDGYLAERLQTAVSDTLRQKLATFVELLDRIDPTDTISAAAGDALRTVMVAFLTMVAFLIIFLVTIGAVAAAIIATISSTTIISIKENAFKYLFFTNTSHFPKINI